MLTQPQEKKFSDWLQKSGHLARTCPVCQGTAWKGREPAVLPDALWDTTSRPGRWKANGSVAAFVVPVECTGCHLVLTYGLDGVSLDP